MEKMNIIENIIDQQKLNNLNDICRTCMSAEGEMQSIFQEISNSDRKLYLIKEMIMSFALIEIVENDGLPFLICTQCIENTQRAFDFKKLCESSNATLRIFYKTQKINSEPIELKLETLDHINSEESNLNFESSEYKYKKLNIVKNTSATKDNQSLDNTKYINDDSSAKSESSQNIFSCTNCDKCFTSQIKLRKHIKNLHGKPKIAGTLLCKVCNQCFSHSQTLARHMKTHQQNKRMELCTVCGKSFLRTDDLKRHSRIHTGERPYSCDQCPKSYKQSSELKDHIKSHSAAKHYMCTECGKSLATRNGLYVHMKVHRGEKNHICKVCGNKYVTTGELNSHMNHIHSKAKPFSCTYEGCSRAFVTKLSLVTHTRSHTGEKPYQCSICNKALATASSLHDHKRTHTGEKLKVCNVCGRRLGNGQALKKHLRIHTGERPYECNTCFEKFICSSSLNSHIKIKHMEKQHQCTVCHKMFALPRKLRQHMKLHSNSEMHSLPEPDVIVFCNICGSSTELCRHKDGQKNIQPIVEIISEPRLVSQIIPVAQLNMPQMILPHFL